MFDGVLELKENDQKTYTRKDYKCKGFFHFNEWDSTYIFKIVLNSSYYPKVCTKVITTAAS